MNNTSIALATALAVSVVSSAFSADINMSADNSAGSSGFNSGTGWTGGQAPAAGNNYFTNDFLLRTPATANTNHTFAGDSLTVNAIGNTLSPTTASGTDLNDAFLFKGTGANNTITVNNLTFDGGILRNASGDADTMHLAGNSLTVTATGMGAHLQGPIFVDAPVHGSSFIVIYDNGSTSAARTLHFTSASSTFDGDIFLATASRSRFALDSTGVFNFTLDGVSSNAISGAGVATIDGTIAINTSAADMTVGNTWNLVSASSKSFGATFAVDGYSDLGGGIWSNGMFEFDTATGALTLTAIPEPSAFAALAGLASLGLVASRRRRRLA